MSKTAGRTTIDDGNQKAEDEWRKVIDTLEEATDDMPEGLSTPERDGLITGENGKAEKPSVKGAKDDPMVDSSKAIQQAHETNERERAEAPNVDSRIASMLRKSLLKVASSLRGLKQDNALLKSIATKNKDEERVSACEKSITDLTNRVKSLEDSNVVTADDKRDKDKEDTKKSRDEDNKVVKSKDKDDDKESKTKRDRDEDKGKKDAQDKEINELFSYVDRIADKVGVARKGIVPAADVDDKKGDSHSLLADKEKDTDNRGADKFKDAKDTDKKKRDKEDKDDKDKDAKKKDDDQKKGDKDPRKTVKKSYDQPAESEQPQQEPLVDRAKKSLAELEDFHDLVSTRGSEAENHDFMKAQQAFKSLIDGNGDEASFNTAVENANHAIARF